MPQPASPLTSSNILRPSGSTTDASKYQARMKAAPTTTDTTPAILQTHRIDATSCESERQAGERSSPPPATPAHRPGSRSTSQVTALAHPLQVLASSRARASATTLIHPMRVCNCIRTPIFAVRCAETLPPGDPTRPTPRLFL